MGAQDMQIRRPRPEGWSFQLVGQWADSLRDAEWVKQHLSRSKRIKVEQPSVAGFPVRYTFDKVRLISLPDTLIVSPQTASKEGLAAVEMVVGRLLRSSEQLPIQKAQLSFGFAEHPDGPASQYMRHQAAGAPEHTAVHRLSVRFELVRDRWPLVLHFEGPQPTGETAITVQCLLPCNGASDLAGLLDMGLAKLLDVAEACLGQWRCQG